MDIYCVAIGGSGMAPLAALLKGRGHTVRGADGPLYPPMSTVLSDAGITPLVGYDPAHLEPVPDLVIIGNAVPRSNAEATEVERRGYPRISMPQALSRFFLSSKQPLVVAGTHGKTTTTAMASSVYTACAQDPGYLIGGLPRDLPSSFHDGSGPRFIIEGDEYNAAYFDRGPKFLHYQPETLILTSAEYDHADLYPTPESLLEAYGQLVELLPTDGLLVACGDGLAVRELARRASCSVVFYGLDSANHVHPVGSIDEGPSGTRFQIEDDAEGLVTLELPCWGKHNVSNALAVWIAARRDGIPVNDLVPAFRRFGGVARRLDELGTVGEITVVDDFAHHPTAVETTVAGLRRRYPGRRLIVLFEPRSLTAGRNLFQDAYRQAFAGVDVALFAPIFHAGRLPEDDRLDLTRLARELAAEGAEMSICDSSDQVLSKALDLATPGDVFVTMSSGSFDGMPHRLLAALQV